MVSACSASRIHRRATWPFSPSRLAMAVPKLPPPNTAMGCRSVILLLSSHLVAMAHYTERCGHGQHRLAVSTRVSVNMPPSSGLKTSRTVPSPGLARPLAFLMGLTLTGLERAHAYELFLDAPELPEVLTATRLQQSPAAVPGSITVLDRELIQGSGAREITELLRLVPGMLVVPEGSATNVNYHGGLAAAARRLQVLVDGRSVYRPALAQVDWVDIPVALEDIERIEVFRGPNTVSYGANALLGVINIITRPPNDSMGTRATYTTGKRGIQDWYARHGFGWQEIGRAHV